MRNGREGGFTRKKKKKKKWEEDVIKFHIGILSENYKIDLTSSTKFY
jgi:hypothetical protein